MVDESILHLPSTFADFLSSSPSTVVSTEKDHKDDESGGACIPASSEDGDKSVAIKVVQTHLSYVCLVNEHAFKLKKSVNLGPPFTDQTRLNERERLCKGELIKNREWNTNDMYLGVFPVCRCKDGSYKIVKTSSPESDGLQVIDWAIWMKRFPCESRLDKVLSREAIDTDMISEFGHRLARLQRRAQRVHVNSMRRRVEEEKSSLSSSSPVADMVAVIYENLDQLLATEMAQKDRDKIETIREWLKSRLSESAELIRSREATGMVRELHADLHSGNLFIANCRIEMFDCLEFNEDLAQIDVVNDLAFLYMDLIYRKHESLAWALVDAWLQETGDFDAVQLLTVFAVYRALVRCKIAALQGERCQCDYLGYLDLCARFIQRKTGAVIAMVGKSGSGKSYWARKLVSSLGGIRIRSDVERKRLYQTMLDDRRRNDQRDEDESKSSSLEEKQQPFEEGDDGFKSKKRAKIGNDELPGLYSAEITTATYDKLNEAVKHALVGRVTIVVDATFLSHRRRHDLVEVVRDMNRSNRQNQAHPVSEHPLPVFVHCTASEEVMKSRILAREQEGKDSSDADLRVLQGQQLDPFAEEDFVIAIQTDGPEEEKDSILHEVSTKLRRALFIEG